MIYKRLVLLLAWTVLWTGFAVDQLLLTYAHMQSRNIYGDKVMIERDGMKFLVDKDLVANEKIENPPVRCGEKDTWEKDLTFQFDFETSEMTVYKDSELSKSVAKIVADQSLRLTVYMFDDQGVLETTPL